MPLYEYECDVCGNRFEQIQKFSDPAVEKCPACEGAVHKLMSLPAIQFKGSGWYITDYARKGQSPDNGSKPASSTERETSSPSSDSPSSSSPAPTPSTGSSSSDS